MSSTIKKYLAHVEVVEESVSSVINSKIATHSRENMYDAFFVGDLGNIVRKFSVWTSQLPRVEPFYAVKVLDDTEVIAVLAQLGAGFDCASQSEIEKVKGLDVPGSRIIYASTSKQTSHIEYARRQDVNLMTFDNEIELIKVKAAHPEAKMVLRIRPPVSDKSMWSLGIKFGCPPDNVARLLRTAKELNIDVVGLSFHVGSNCYDVIAYTSAIAYSRTVFDIAKSEGYNFKLLDIGGGFAGKSSAKLPFEQLASVLRPTLDEYFPETMGVRIIAEPGRYFAASALTLATSIISKRDVFNNNYTDEKDAYGDTSIAEDEKYMYYINDGVYGCLSGVRFKSELPFDWSLVEDKWCGNEPRFNSIVWGPTCDEYDCVLKDVLLPLLNVGDWILFSNLGAYSRTLACGFNGMRTTKCHYVINHVYWRQLQSALHLQQNGSSVDCENPTASD